MESSSKDSLKQNTYQTIKISDIGIESHGETIEGINVSTLFGEEYEKMSKASNPYADGKSSKRIADAIIERYK